MTTILTEGFENDQDWHHRVQVFPVGGKRFERETGNIFVPQHWEFWYRHQENVWSQPEAHHVHKNVDRHRVRTGNFAYMMFGFWRNVDGGLYRQVQVEAGQRLNLSAFLHCWSNGCGSGRPDDGRWSDGTLVGYNEVALTEADIPATNGDEQNDANGNMRSVIGIDPTGGTDPFAPSVVWGEPLHCYNSYTVPLIAEATAQGNTVTVFIRSTSLFALKHLDTYIDDVLLEATDDPEPPDPPEPERGAPRVQYERTYILLPPSADADWALAAIGATWDDKRYTVGASADDAAVGNLDTRNIIAVNPDLWPGDLAEFYAEWYPGVSVEYINADTPEQLARLLSLPDPQPPTTCLCQRDAPWAGERLAGDDCTLTIGDKGCYITALAEAQRHYGIDYDATPLTIQDALLPDGFAGCLPLWPAIQDRCELTVSSITTAEADAWLDAGNCAMIEVQPSTLQHFVLAIGRMADGDYIVANPWTGEVGPLADMYDGVESWRKLEPVGTPPEPPTPDTRTRIGLHLQTMTGGWDTFTAALQPAVGKVLASMQDVAGIKRHSIDTAVVWRHVTNDYGDTLEHPDPAQGARNWVDKFRDSLYQVCDDLAAEFPGLTEPLFYVESLNEVYPSLNAPLVQRAANFDLAFIEELENLGLPVKPVVFCAAVGNPHESEYHLLVPLARRCAEVGGLMGYHNYWRAIDGQSLLASEWEHYGGRWQEMDRVFVANGVHVRWYGGESGAYATAHDGWKSPLCYNGNWDKYQADIVEMQRRIREWNSTHGGRFVGSVLFTTGESYTGWDNFQIRGDETAALTEAL